MRSRHDENTLRALARRVGYGDVDDRFREALTHASVDDPQFPNNERLEFLGDAVLGLVVADVLLTDHPDRPEGWLSRRRAALVNTESLARHAWRLGLLGGLLARMSVTEMTSSAKIAASTFEAVIGAMFLSCGMDAVRAFVSEQMAEGLSYDGDHPEPVSPKSRLQRLVQQRGMSPPKYTTQRAGEETQATAWAGGVVLGTGAGRNRKAAEDDAARNALNDPRHGFDTL